MCVVGHTDAVRSRGFIDKTVLERSMASIEVRAPPLMQQLCFAVAHALCGAGLALEGRHLSALNGRLEAPRAELGRLLCNALVDEERAGERARSAAARRAASLTSFAG